MSNQSNGKSVGKVASLLLRTTLLAALAAITAGQTNAEAATALYAAGSSHTLVLNEDGSVWAVGDNGYGQLGNGTSSWWHSYEPQRVKGLSEVVAVAAAGAHSVALRSDGTVWAWGNNAGGQLGNGEVDQSALPLQVKGISKVVAIATGSSHVLALKSDGSVWAWGNNRIGQLGNESRISSDRPVPVSGLSGVRAIAAGNFHSLALKEDGTVWSWGYNAYGALGNGVFSSKGTSVPVRIGGLTDVKTIAAGMQHSVALKSDGTAWVWGDNSYSQNGNGTRSKGIASPVMVSGIRDLTDLTAKSNHTIALRSDGTVWAWGDAGRGEWGSGFAMNGSDKPIQMRGVSGATKVAAVFRSDSIPGLSNSMVARDTRETGKAGVKLASHPERPTLLGNLLTVASVIEH